MSHIFRFVGMLLDAIDLVASNDLVHITRLRFTWAQNRSDRQGVLGVWHRVPRRTGREDAGKAFVIAAAPFA